MLQSHLNRRLFIYFGRSSISVDHLPRIWRINSTLPESAENIHEIYSFRPCFSQKCWKIFWQNLLGVAAKKSLQALLKWLFSNLKTAMSNGCRICVQWAGKHSRWISFTLASSITSMDIWDKCPSSITNTGRTGGMLAIKNSNHSTKVAWSIHPLSVHANIVPGTAPFLRLSAILLRG